MTAAAASVPELDEWTPYPSRARLRHVAQITMAGDVVLTTTWAWRSSTDHGALRIAARPISRTVLGHVYPDDPDGWRHAERLLRVAGYRPAADWTTFARMPVVLVEPWVKHFPGALRAGDQQKGRHDGGTTQDTR